MKSNRKAGEISRARDHVAASIARGFQAQEAVQVLGRYDFECWGPLEKDRERFLSLRAAAMGDRQLLARLKAIPQELKWRASAHNLVVTLGKNFILDNALAGSAYTATMFLGLISSVGYSAIVAGDTMASHAGWTEAAAANAPDYDQATRPAISWAAASGGAKATAAVAVYSINEAGTVKGAFMTTNNTKDGTTGTLISAALFTEGDKIVGDGDTLNGAYTMTLT